MKTMTRSLRIALLSLLLLTSLAGCCLPYQNDMPFNGDVTFHELHVTIPTSFIRDSTQSHDALWIFEHGNYAKLILLSRSEISEDEQRELQDYAELMQERGAAVQLTEFLGKGAVHSTYTLDGVFCQEMLFAHNGYFYAVALRGGTEQEFSDLLASVSLVSASVEM